MKEEFTTAMHADMLGISQQEASLLEMFARINSGEKKLEVCKRYGVSEKYYDDNIDSVLAKC